MVPIDQMPAIMARTVAAWLPTVDRAGYVAFLDMMVHYTRRSGDRLRHAAAVASEPRLRRFFAELADDEMDHWRLAAADLSAMGGAPSDEVPAEVAAFEAFWWGVEPADELVFLGALYVLERVGGHLQEPARAALGRLGLNKQQARFILVHLEVDADHGARADELVRALGPGDVATLTRGATQAMAHWLAIHRRALG